MAQLDTTSAHTSRARALGVMGGGQLGRMFVHTAQRMGFSTLVLDPDSASPAGRVSHQHVQTPYLDAQGLQLLAQQCSAVTTEFENVPASALEQLAQTCFVAPNAQAVNIAQDRVREKTHLARYAAFSGVSVAPYAVIENSAQLAAIDDALFPGILKISRMGYDGKGQVRVHNREGLHAAWRTLKEVPCVLEQMLPLVMECSVVVARGVDGTCVHLPVQRNVHRDGILAVTEVYAENVPPGIAHRAQEAAKAIAQGLQYVGVLCVEFFVLSENVAAAFGLGSLIVNEMAPRPHNSGHYSLDACDVSQFELQVRTLAQLPLTQPRQHSPAIMLNLLGDLWLRTGADALSEPPWLQVLALPGAHLHLYGKGTPQPGRKMGHVTFTAASVEQVRSTALKAARILGLAAF